MAAPLQQAGLNHLHHALCVAVVALGVVVLVQTVAEEQRHALIQVPLERIMVTGLCTYHEYHDFFSARRLGIHSGRIYTGIML